jgi:hypothetical protein
MMDDRRKSDTAVVPEKSRNASTADAMEGTAVAKGTRLSATGSGLRAGQVRRARCLPRTTATSRRRRRPWRLASVRDRPPASVPGRTRDARAR